MNYAIEWNEAHGERLMIAADPDPRLVEFAAFWDDKLKIARDAGLDVNSSEIVLLDIGCGTGRSAEWLSARGYTVCAFDSSPNAVMRAYHRLTAQRLRLPRFMIADLTKPWPYTPGTFTGVVDIRALENLNIEEITFAWTQVARVLMRGGRFLSVCASPDRDDALTTAGEVTKLTSPVIELLCKTLGFTADVQSEECVHENGKVVHDWRIVATKA